MELNTHSYLDSAEDTGICCMRMAHDSALVGLCPNKGHCSCLTLYTLCSCNDATSSPFIVQQAQSYAAPSWMVCHIPHFAWIMKTKILMATS